jgi:hypothetical protein
VSRQRSAGLALLLVFLLAHLALLPKTLEDIDSINFALGVRQFDVARHQPHPPGYPVYIAISKTSTAVLRMAGVEAPAVRGLAIWSALAGAAALPALLLFFRRLEGRGRLAWWAALVVAASPLFWFSALRPLSDMVGFAAVMWTLALLAGRPTDRGLITGALVAGFAIGIRSQTAVLTAPLLAVTLFRTRDARARMSAVGAFAAGALAWGIPLLVASGGLSAYLQALGSQAGEDFSGSHMLWTNLTNARAAVNALLNTFVWPWDWWLGIAVCMLAALGAARVAWRAPGVLLSILVAFLPYAVFHLLFQETVTTRYALPLLPVIAYLAMAAVEGLPARALPVAAIGIAAISLMQSVPADRSLWPRPAKCSCAGDTTWASYRSSRCTWRVRGLGVEIAITPFRSCAPPSTTWLARNSCWGGAFQRRAFWWRPCWIAGLTMMWPKPKPRSTG